MCRVSRVLGFAERTFSAWQVEGRMVEFIELHGVDDLEPVDVGLGNGVHQHGAGAAECSRTQ